MRRLLPLVLSFLTVPAFSETRDTSVPDNFVSVYMGFNNVSNTSIKTTGDDSSWIGDNTRRPFELNMNNLEQKNSVWGGFSGGHWFKQAPVSIGMSGSFDIFTAVVKEQTTSDFTVSINGVDRTANYTSFTKYRTSVVQMVPGMNLLVGVPLKFVRLYGGAGPGLFISMYSFTLKNAAGRETGSVTATDAKLGYNAFFGGDVFISKHWSAFLEAKFSEVRNLKFTPNKNDPLMAGRTITDTYSKIATQRVAVGASYHF